MNKPLTSCRSITWCTVNTKNYEPILNFSYQSIAKILMLRNQQSLLQNKLRQNLPWRDDEIDVPA